MNFNKKETKRLTKYGTLCKVPSYVIPLEQSFWIKNFLYDRLITKAVHDQNSNFHVNIPGSVLATALFLLYINDLLSHNSNLIHSYVNGHSLKESVQYTSQA